jgi:hypothetical protein
MTMTPRLRKFALTAHVTSAVGWLGAVVAYLALTISGLSSPNAQTVRAAYISMELIGWYVIVPFAFTSLLTGLVQSLGTEWGLFRHYWVLTKFLLTVGAVTVLLLHIPAVSRTAGIAAETTPAGSDHREQQIQFVVHAGGGLAVLLTATTLSVFKPWGITRYGRRTQEERPQASPAILATTPDASVRREAETKPISHAKTNATGSTRLRWRLYLVIGIVGLVILLIVLHLSGAPRHH